MDFGIGDVFGSWDHTNPPYQFTVDNANEVIKFNDVANDGELRMHVAASTLDIGDDWWRAEFIIIDGNIEYRGRGGDQTRVSVTAGQDISLNFKAGTGSITD